MHHFKLLLLLLHAVLISSSSSRNSSPQQFSQVLAQADGPSPSPAPAPSDLPLSTDPSELAVLRAVPAASWSSFSGSDPCRPPTSWPGIKCTSSSSAYHVSGVTLSQDTPRALATLLTLASELKRLQSLQISHTFSATASSSPPSFTIPESLGQLEQLRELDLSDNGFNLGGRIPVQLANLTGLTRLILAGNQLDGPVPGSLCGLTSLKHLDLSRNRLDGSVPSCLSSLVSLGHLDFGSNRLTGRIPEQLGLFSGLLYLNLENNELQGEIPESLLALTSLQTLKCGRNFLGGRLPDQIGQLKSLQVLDVSFNSDITGTIPSSVGDLTELVDVRLFSTGLNGSIPEEIGKLANLTTLMLHSNLISGTVPASLSGLSKLQLLQLQGNRLGGPLPGSVFKGLSSLQGLYLQHNSFTGSFPVEITRISSLSVLNLGFNQLEGGLPDELGDMINLEWLLLGGNRFSDQIPDSLGKLSKLRLLDLSGNLLNTSLPSSAVLANKFMEYDFQFNAFNSSGMLHDLCVRHKPCLTDSEAISDSFSINSGGPAVNASSSSSGQLLFEADNVYVNNSVAFSLVQPTCSSSSASWGIAVTGSAKSSQVITAASPINASAAAGIDLPIIAELYKTARVGGDSIAYHGRCMKPGTYTVELHFVELKESSPGRRVFDVLIQDRLVHERLDVVSTAGGAFVPLVQQYQAEVGKSSSTLKIELRGSGSWNTSDSYNGPTIAAVRVYPNTTAASSSSGGSKSRELWAILGGSAGILALICTGLFIALNCWLRRAEKRVRIAGSNTGTAADEENDLHNSLSFSSQIGSLTSFEYSELVDATEKFAAHNLLGQGAHGRVFKGVLPSGKVVAVKQLVHRTPTCKKWFHHELQVISSVRHRNLVPLIGCCIDRGFPLLVCEFMPNGNLQNALFGKGSQSVLSWELRFRVAADVARGLHYLHQDRGGMKIIHRDVKPANILLDSEMRAHISDFGLAKLMDHHEDSEVVVSSVMGTRGYLAPEYVLNGQLSEKADVYSYGIVLLELLSGRRGMQTSMNLSMVEPVSIDEWVWEALVSDRIQAVADPRLGGRYPVDEMVKVIQVAMWCTQGLPEWRPGMGQVAEMLSDQLSVPELPSERISWDDFKDVMASSSKGLTTNSSSSSFWEPMMNLEQSSMSGYQTANGATLPDPRSHEEDEQTRLRGRNSDSLLAPPPSSCS